MKAYDVLIKESGNYDLPILVISSAGFLDKYDSVQEYINLHLPDEYVQACVQLDYLGNDSFVILYIE